jgi:hypothetical protein
MDSKSDRGNTVPQDSTVHVGDEHQGASGGSGGGRGGEQAGKALIDDILVSDQDSFDLSVYYKREGSQVTVVPATDKLHMPDAKLITITFRLPDWETSRKIMMSSSYIIEGRQTMDNSAFRKALFESTATSWNVIDSEGNPLALDAELLARTRPDIMRCFLDLLERKLVEEDIYPSIIGS